MPELDVPDAFESICNLHFKTPRGPAEATFHGVIGGLTEWIFLRETVISVTISAANRHAHLGQEAIAAQVWQEVCQVLGQTLKLPPYRVLWEKRATFACTPRSWPSGQDRAAPPLGCAGRGLDRHGPAGDD
ncbi:hypothetical protein [Acidocella sp. MX-AZ03]|uniref:hypothetical protein n=1 Tax=Acidocella sp. MX-AZ03 TaxID=2697363 RepID=UPI002FD7A3AC